MAGYSEADMEQHVLDVLGDLEWEHVDGVAVAPGSPERESWSQVVLQDTFLRALRNLNPGVPDQYLRQAAAEITTPASQDVVAENARLHHVLVHGYDGVTYVDRDGRQVTPNIVVVSGTPSRNVYQAVNQLIVRSHGRERRFDVVAYVNGLPLAVLELKKSGAREDAQVAYNQLQTYLDELPMAFRFAVLVVASDGLTARYGTPFTPWNHFAPWNVDDDGAPLPAVSVDEDGDVLDQLDQTLHGLFNTERFGQLMRDYVAFDSTEGGLVKRIAKPHQYFAVTKAVASTVAALDSDGRAGVVWHTQGSGKSMEMELYAAKIMRHPRMANPTLVVITDRTELDGQLFDTFNRSGLLPEKPVQVSSRDDLRRELADRTQGGIYFTTLQKFGLTKDERDAGIDHPLLSARRNVVVIADEAHRSHYDDLDGYARHLRDALPHATLIAFTGTPISEGERDTRRVFGDDIDVYDLQRAVDDGATVPVAFEARLIPLARVDDIDDTDLDDAAEELTAALDDADRDRLQRAVATLETVYGAPDRVRVLARDIVTHWETRREVMRPFIDGPGKAMIVTATRSIAARLYDEIVALRPDWADDADDKGRIKVVYTATPGEPAHITKHLRRPSAQKAVKARLKSPDDELELVIVKDMMLTGFDAPALHTLYVDRPLKGALLMQTLARVNRTFRGKTDGLLVAYAPIAENLQQALAEWTNTEGPAAGNTVGRDAAEAAQMVADLLGELQTLAPADWTAARGNPTAYRAALIGVINAVRSPATPGNRVDDDPTARPVADAFRSLTARLERAWALTAGSSDAEPYRQGAKFYIEARRWMAKLDAEERAARGEPVPDDIKRLLRELVVTSSQADRVVDIYGEAGLDLPLLSDLTPQWAAEVAKPSKAHLAIERLKNSLLEESIAVTGGNEVRQRLFSERIRDLMTRYTNQQLTAAEVIAALVEMAKDIAAEPSRGERFTPALTHDELAFYDVVALNESAVDVLGDDVLATIARELVATMQRDTRTDWTVREDVRAKLRASIKRLLRKHGYPPDKAPAAIEQVMDQMVALAPRYAEENR